jgi:hypothetical protein
MLPQRPLTAFDAADRLRAHALKVDEDGELLDGDALEGSGGLDPPAHVHGHGLLPPGSLEGFGSRRVDQPVLVVPTLRAHAIDDVSERFAQSLNVLDGPLKLAGTHGLDLVRRRNARTDAVAHAGRCSRRRRTTGTWRSRNAR